MRFCFIFFAFFSVAVAQYYVAPAGSDDNPGTIDKPFATIEKAKSVVRDVRSQSDKDITVYLRGGMYKLDKSVVFGVEDGSEQCSITYRNYENEEPIISSGIRVEGWRKLSDKPDGLPDASLGNVYVADIPAGIDRFYSLYDGIYRLPRARSKGFKPTQGAKDKGISRSELHYPEGTVLKNWDNIEDVEIVIRPFCLWTMNILPLARVDEGKRIAYTSLEGSYPLTRERINRFGPESVWVENVLEALDEPGEWVVNTKTRKIYLWPKKDIRQSEIYVPKLRQYFFVSGDEKAQKPVSHINFKGLTFVHADRDVWTDDDAGLQHDWEMYDKDNAMLRFRWAQDCEVSECAFVGSANTAIRLDLYAQDITIENNMIAHLGGSGVVLAGYGPGDKDLNKYNRILNNHIHHIGQLYWHNSAILLFQSGTNRIANNLIHNTPYNAISIGGVHPPTFDSMKKADGEYSRELQRTVDLKVCGNVLKYERKTYWKDILPFIHGRDNVIEDNEIHHALEILGDGNGIYIRMVPPGNVIRRNYLHDIDGFGTAIRADDDQFDCVFEKNVIANCSFGGICIKRRNKVFNNIIYNISRKKMTTNDTVEEPAGYLVFRGGSKASRDLDAPPIDECVVRRNIFCHTLSYEPVYYSELNENWPKEYYEWMHENLTAPDVDYNVFYWNKDQDFVQSYVKEVYKVRGDDNNSLVADPMFVDPDNGDFRFKPGSPAFEMRIESVDVRETGLTKKFPNSLRKYSK